jgi:DNA-binding IclR family transcriptional regulator
MEHRLNAGIGDRTPALLVPAVTHAIDILNYLAHESPEAGVSEIARALNINKSTCFNILAALAAAQLVSKHARYAAYRLGPRLIELGAAARRNISRHAAMREQVRRLVDDVGLTCVVGQVLADSSGIVIVDRLLPQRPDACSAPIGHIYPMSAPAMGLVVLAGRDEAQALDLARSNQLLKADGGKDFVAQMREIRKRGYAVDLGDFRPEINAVAVVANQSDEMETVLCILGYTRHLPRKKVDVLGERLVALARSVNVDASLPLLSAR